MRLCFHSLFVWLWPGLHKNYWTHCIEIWRKAGVWTKEEPINLWSFGRSMHTLLCPSRFCVWKRYSEHNSHDAHPSQVNKSASSQRTLHFGPCFRDSWTNCSLCQTVRYTWRSEDTAVMFLECIPWLTARYQVASSVFVIAPCNQVFTWYLWSATLVTGSVQLPKPVDTLQMGLFNPPIITPTPPPHPQPRHPFAVFTFLFIFICRDFL